MLVPMKDPGAMKDLVTSIGQGTLRGDGKICRTSKTGMHPLGRDSTTHPHQGIRGCHPMMLLRCTMHNPICHHLHHQMLVLHQLISPMLPTRRQVMHQTVDKIISKVVLLVTKVALLVIKVATKVTKAVMVVCRVAQALLIRATLDIKGEGQVTRVAALHLISKVTANPLSKVETHLLTKVAILAMAMHKATKVNQATQTITAQVHHPMREGTDLGGIASRTLLEDMCRSQYGLNSSCFLFS